MSGVASPAEFDRAVTAAAAARATGGPRWLRVTGWHEHSGGPLDRYRLDLLGGQVPVRVQHRSGAMWVLNSAALGEVGAESCESPGAERDEQGRLTGRLVRMDSWLRDRLPAAADDFAARVAAYAAAAARLGLTGFTDATPDRDQSDVAEFAALAAAGALPQRLVLMGAPGLTTPGAGRVSLGAVKLMLDDATLPSAGELAQLIADAHGAGSAVAVHCVTAEQLVVTVAALAAAGPAADRIEHASVVPPGYAASLAKLDVAVVTQPGFIATRGDDYRRDVEPAEQDWLYPCASLIRAGVPVAGGTDAPFGPSDPWRCIAAAVSRRTPSGNVLGRAERVSASRALRLFLALPDDLSRVRTVARGQPSDLCLLHAPRREALARPSAEMVRATIIGGSAVVG